ncbi:unnamed protein product [Symbiodinium natans]|uniref:Nucleotide-diphospho-sugar transferase domain-containing protein n=1 Tax=Symbiodinium natans TaxID=878477 RepID=A0A812NVM4_9DINO|nr:unnamed protein product [Symbiodinium natans]
MSDRVLDCIIPAHEKDFATLGHAVRSLRRTCPEVQRILVVSKSPWEDAAVQECGVEWVDEADACWPFHLGDSAECGCVPGWLFQQLLKLYGPLLLNLTEQVLVCDADVVWLAERSGHSERLKFLDEGRALLCTFDSENCPPIRSAVDLHRYDAFVAHVLPGLAKARPERETAVCHHSVLDTSILRALFAEVERAWPGHAFWEAFLAAARACDGRASEYELYSAFARSRFPQRVGIRALPFAVVADLQATISHPPAGVAFAVAHSHLRDLPDEELKDRVGIINGNTEQEILRRLAGERLASGAANELIGILNASGMIS